MSNSTNPTPPTAGNGGAPAACPSAGCGTTDKKLLTIRWTSTEVWCSEDASLSGTTQNYDAGQKVRCEVKAGSTSIATFEVQVTGNSFSHTWKVIDVLPSKAGAHYETEKSLDVLGNGIEAKSTTPLKIKFVPTLPKTRYEASGARFNLEAEDYVVKISENVEYVKGWAASVVKLGTHGTGVGGLLDGKLSWNGYRWMKRVGTADKFWDGSGWQDLPSGFTLSDANNFCVGFYKNGSKYTCQYGGDWPETFTDWAIDAADKQAVITSWKDAINQKWTGKFDLKRNECTSTNAKCCRYSTTTTSTFTLKDSFVSGRLIISDGYIRSNSGLFFIGGRVASFPHEFGHWLGNPDEYAGATSLDTSVNEDGASGGIDATSLMGTSLDLVKKRHFKTVCKHLATMVKTKTGKDWTYAAVPL